MTILTYVIRNKTKYIRMTLQIINILSMFGVNFYVRKVKEIKQDQKVSEADPPDNQKVTRSEVSKLRNSKVNM